MTIITTYAQCINIWSFIFYRLPAAMTADTVTSKQYDSKSFEQISYHSPIIFGFKNVVTFQMTSNGI